MKERKKERLILSVLFAALSVLWAVSLFFNYRAKGVFDRWFLLQCCQVPFYAVLAAAHFICYRRSGRRPDDE